MTNWKSAYEQWLHYNKLDDSLKEELNQLKNKEEELEDAFYQDLSFGTGGMRGIMGPGSNRMNIYTIRKAVTGLANYILVNSVNVKDRGVVVAYDTRYKSREFAVEAAKVLGYHGIKTHVFESKRPTPLLSFAVRYLGTAAGIMITASHNPPEYNGFKVYNEDGGQMVPGEADQVIAAVEEIDNPFQIPVMEESELEDKGLIDWLGADIDNAYLEQLSNISKLDSDTFWREKDLEIIFTPLHGTSEKLVMEGLKQLNFTQVHLVEEQATADPEFSTVSSPNPEEHQAFQLAIELGKEKHATILLATDPDSDRLGVAVFDKQTEEYKVLSGNQLGILLLNYILLHTDPSIYKNARLLKSIVTTEMGRTVAKSYGVQTIDTLTGFKYIGEKIHEFDTTGETFVFGFEESYGYLISSFARDKDAVQAAVMACEMAYYWEQKGKTLLEALDLLYEQHGYYQEGMTSITLQGKEGSEKIAKMMETHRNEKITTIGGLSVVQVEDYLASEHINLATNERKSIELPKENVLKFLLENDSWVCLRPSGTEPKIKCYYGVREDSQEKSDTRLKTLKNDMESRLQTIIDAN
ncbi:phospho-sugar mutase [Virgibacillus sp. MSJ-26]|uniref:phospho-sugar mutase n=1 Tax=Virgibacillus sp. MSJ-26 TaxID=2841522 RepID=UPI001C10A23D|nr:phospho-sugar mutase [Virgibacillus sp. MSJ-26]MBU5465986.1 phospho-sugar mutase [Virgibacillus sp. MSJ-26]